MKHWIYPANPKYYDLEAAFKEKETPWPMSSKVNVGDNVYIYAGNPYKQILFKCEVLDINLPEVVVMDIAKKFIKVEGKSSKKKFMLLNTIKDFEMNEVSPLSFSNLRQNGLKGSIMGPQCLENNIDLFNYINNIEK